MAFPSWVEKFKAKGVYVGKNQQGYFLYRAHCVRDPITKKPKTVIDEYLGTISETNGFVPKVNKLPSVGIEYGLTHFIYSNFKRCLTRHVFNADKINTDTLIVMATVSFALGSLDCLPLSYLSVSKNVLSADNLTDRKLKTIANLEKVVRENIKRGLVGISLEYFCCKLKNILAFKTKNSYEFMSLDSETLTTIKKAGWSY